MHSYDRPPILLEAANVLRERAAAAADDQRERWMVDQSPEHGLIVGSYMPGDVAPDGTVSTSCAAYFAYPGDDGRTFSNALGVASLMATLDPPSAVALADWLEATYQAWNADRAADPDDWGVLMRRDSTAVLLATSVMRASRLEA